MGEACLANAMGAFQVAELGTAARRSVLSRQYAVFGRTVNSSQLPRVRIVNKEHPHYPENGRWTGEVVLLLGRIPMGKVLLDACPHGVDACFVSQGDILSVEPSRN